MAGLKLEIVTPDRVVLDEIVDYVGAPGVGGEFGILPGHVPLLSALSVGALYFRQGSSTSWVFVSGGFAEVAEDKITILAEAAEQARDIDVARAESAKRRAEDRLSATRDAVDVVRAHAALSRALARTTVAQR